MTNVSTRERRCCHEAETSHTDNFFRTRVSLHATLSWAKERTKSFEMFSIIVITVSSFLQQMGQKDNC